MDTVFCFSKIRGGRGEFSLISDLYGALFLEGPILTPFRTLGLNYLNLTKNNHQKQEKLRPLFSKKKEGGH